MPSPQRRRPPTGRLPRLGLSRRLPRLDPRSGVVEKRRDIHRITGVGEEPRGSLDISEKVLPKVKKNTESR